MDNLILIAGAMGIIIGGLGYYYSRAANGLFLLSLLAIGYAAVVKMKATGEIHYLSTGVGEAPLTELMRKLGWSVEIFDRLAANVQTAILVFVGAFFIARIIAWIACAKRGEVKETQQSRRRRILKKFGIKNMKELRRLYYDR